MEWTSSEVVAVIAYLLPGFLAAWIFHGLTAHPTKSPFERVIQALIFTAIVQGLTAITKLSLDWAGQWVTVGPWSREVGYVWSLIHATTLGLVLALLANKDWLHWLLREKLRMTSRTSFPSEWFSAFHQERRRVILHLEGGRRLHGWPYDWPDHSESGHFVIMEPCWVLSDNQMAVLHEVERLVIPATQVEMVELLKLECEITASAEDRIASERMLVDLATSGEDEDGKQSAATTTQERPIDKGVIRQTNNDAAEAPDSASTSTQEE